MRADNDHCVSSSRTDATYSQPLPCCTQRCATSQTTLDPAQGGSSVGVVGTLP
jgi:hypothetical protein